MNRQLVKTSKLNDTSVTAELPKYSYLLISFLQFYFYFLSFAWSKSRIWIFSQKVVGWSQPSINIEDASKKTKTKFCKKENFVNYNYGGSDVMNGSDMKLKNIERLSKSIHFWNSAFHFMKTRFFSWCQLELA